MTLYPKVHHTVDHQYEELNIWDQKWFRLDLTMLHKLKHCLVIWVKLVLSNCVLKCNSWQLFNRIHYISFYQSYLTLSRWMCSDSLTLSSCHILLPFSKLMLNVRNVGVWIHFGLTVYIYIHIHTICIHTHTINSTIYNKLSVGL